MLSVIKMLIKSISQTPCLYTIQVYYTYIIYYIYSVKYNCLFINQMVNSYYCEFVLYSKYLDVYNSILQHWVFY